MDNTMPKGFSMEKFRAFASGPAGQKLLKMMQEKNGSALQAAALHASRGDAQKAKAELTSLLSDPEVRAILDQYGGTHGGI